METKPPYQIERLETLLQLDALEEEWAELIAEIPEAPIFLSWEWIRTWWTYFGKAFDLWLLTARDAQGRLLGIAPLMRERQRTGLIPLQIIGFIGIGLTRPVNLNILAHPSDPEGILQAFLDFLLSQSKQWDVIRLSPMSKETAVCGLLNNGNGHFRTGMKTVNAYIPLPDSWETYSKTLTKKLRRNLKYFRTKLEDDYLGRVHFAYLTDPQELPDVIKKMEELNKGRWVSKKRVSNYAYSNYSAFHEAFAKLMLERGWLRLNQLIVSGNVIAISYNFLFHDRIYAQSITFDIGWSGYSPGRLLIANSIQTSIEEGAREYNWLGGDEIYKLAWTDQIRQETELLYSRNWLGNIWVEWRSMQVVARESIITKGRQWFPQSTRDRINQYISTLHRKMEKQVEREAQ